MKNIYYISLLLALFSCKGNAAPPTPQDVKAEQLNQFLNVRSDAAYIYPTKFGEIKFVRHDGTLGTPADKITLNDKTLLSTEGQTDSQGGWVSIMTEIMTNTSIESAPRRPGQIGQAETKRMIIRLGGDGNCIKKFIILDFTGQKPFVSEKFGLNPNDQFCLIFKKAKWGKKESEIVLNGPANYIYYTLDKIVGPFAYE